MSRSVFAAALALAVTLPAVSAHAQSIRTFVSTGGTDNASCSITQPCRHFQAAVNATALGGEVDALDAGAYGSFIISQAITIEGQSWSYVAPGANGNAITINAVSGKVSIHGVSLNGVGSSGSTTGIQFNSGGSLNVANSVIRNFAASGIAIVSGTGSVDGVLDHVTIEDNGAFGVNIVTTIPTNVTISECVIAHNGFSGVNANSSGVTNINAMVRNSTIAYNGTGLQAIGGGGSVRVTRSTITGNTVAWNSGSGGQVTSYNDNNIEDNGSFDPTLVEITYK